MNSYSVLISKHYFQNLQMQNWSIFILLKMHQESQKWEWRFLTFRLQYKCLYGNYMYEAIKSTAMEFSLYSVACCQSYHICCNISYLCSRATRQLALKTHTYSEMHTQTHRNTHRHTCKINNLQSHLTNKHTRASLWYEGFPSCQVLVPKLVYKVVSSFF